MAGGAAVGGLGMQALTITLSVHESPAGGKYVRGVLWTTIAGRYGSQGGVTLHLPEDSQIGDAEELLALCWPLLHTAVYSS